MSKIPCRICHRINSLNSCGLVSPTILNFGTFPGVWLFCQFILITFGFSPGLKFNLFNRTIFSSFLIFLSFWFNEILAKIHHFTHFPISRFECLFFFQSEFVLWTNRNTKFYGIISGARREFVLRNTSWGWQWAPLIADVWSHGTNRQKL